jgi:hypothetical protein
VGRGRADQHDGEGDVPAVYANVFGPSSLAGRPAEAVAVRIATAVGTAGAPHERQRPAGRRCAPQALTKRAAIRSLAVDRVSAIGDRPQRDGAVPGSNRPRARLTIGAPVDLASMMLVTEEAMPDQGELNKSFVILAGGASDGEALEVVSSAPPSESDLSAAPAFVLDFARAPRQSMGPASASSPVAGHREPAPHGQPVVWGTNGPDAVSARSNSRAVRRIRGRTLPIWGGRTT